MNSFNKNELVKNPYIAINGSGEYFNVYHQDLVYDIINNITNTHGAYFSAVIYTTNVNKFELIQDLMHCDVYNTYDNFINAVKFYQNDTESKNKILFIIDENVVFDNKSNDLGKLINNACNFNHLFITINNEIYINCKFNCNFNFENDNITIIDCNKYPINKFKYELNKINFNFDKMVNNPCIYIEGKRECGKSVLVNDLKIYLTNKYNYDKIYHFEHQIWYMGDNEFDIINNKAVSKIEQSNIIDELITYRDDNYDACILIILDGCMGDQFNNDRFYNLLKSSNTTVIFTTQYRSIFAKKMQTITDYRFYFNDCIKTNQTKIIDELSKLLPDYKNNLKSYYKYYANVYSTMVVDLSYYKLYSYTVEFNPNTLNSDIIDNYDNNNSVKSFDNISVKSFDDNSSVELLSNNKSVDVTIDTVDLQSSD